MEKSEPLIPVHGGYRKLKSFQISQLVYDVTVRFCNFKTQKADKMGKEQSTQTGAYRFKM